MTLVCLCGKLNDEAIRGIVLAMDCHAPQGGARKDNFFFNYHRERSEAIHNGI